MAVNISFGKVGNYGDGSKFPALIASTISTASAITASGSNQQSSVSAPQGGYTPVCRVATDAAIFVAFGADPNATTTSARVWMPANSVEYFAVEPGDKVAVITG